MIWSRDHRELKYLYYTETPCKGNNLVFCFSVLDGFRVLTKDVVSKQK